MQTATQMGPSGRHESYRPDIDGLRAVAVLAVLAFHAFPQLVPGGFTGVDVFFVVSGYLITGTIIGRRAKGLFTLRDFYARRIRRIFPALTVVVASVLVAGSFLLLPLEFAQVARHAAASAVFGSNFLLWNEAGYFDVASHLKPLLHLWSLAIEEQFYIVWPLLLLLLLRFGRFTPLLVVALAAMSLATSVWLVAHDAVAAFYSPLSRAFELLVGCALALSPKIPARLVLVRTAAGGLGLAAILASFFWFNLSTPFPGFAALFVCLGSALVIAAGETATTNRYLLANRVAAGTGRVSYALYLWHWPLLVLPTILPSPIALSDWHRLALLGVAGVLAVLTTKLVEEPIRFRWTPQWSVPALAAAMILIGGAGLYANDGAPQRFPQDVRAVLAYETYPPGIDARANVCWVTATTEWFEDECSIGRNGNPPGLVVWGDSHAGRLYAGLAKAYGPDAGIGQFVRDGCAPVVGYGYPSCQQSNARIASLLIEWKPRVVMFAHWSIDDAEMTAVGETVAHLRAAGLDVTVVGPAPHWTPSVPRQLYLHWAETGSIAARIPMDAARRVPEIDARLRTIATSAGAAYVSLVDRLCSAEGCLTAVDGSGTRLLSWDYGHLTTEGAVYVVELMKDAGWRPAP